MAFVFRVILLVFIMVATSFEAQAKGDFMAERSLGKNDAPIRVDEYTSMTCIHCADFTLNILPEIEKRYIETGKVRFVLHDFPLSAFSLKAAVVARCMPKDTYFPFMKVLFGALKEGKFHESNSENVLYQYAALGGLAPDRAKACADDSALQNEIIAVRTEAEKKYKIEATPTFVINNGAEIINGAVNADAFFAVFDRLLAAKK